MTHKNYRELQQYELTLRKEKISPLIEQIRNLTLAEAVKLQEVISQLMWFSMNDVEEKQLLNAKPEENVKELI